MWWGGGCRQRGGWALAENSAVTSLPHQHRLLNLTCRLPPTKSIQHRCGPFPSPPELGLNGCWGLSSPLLCGFTCSFVPSAPHHLYPRRSDSPTLALLTPAHPASHFPNISSLTRFLCCSPLTCLLPSYPILSSFFPTSCSLGTLPAHTQRHICGFPVVGKRGTLVQRNQT